MLYNYYLFLGGVLFLFFCICLSLRIVQVLCIRAIFNSNVMSKIRLPLNHAYDTLYYDQTIVGKTVYILRIKKYRYDYKFPLVSISIMAFPLQDNFEDVCPSVSDVLTIEEPVKSSLSLDEMKHALYVLFSNRFLQQSFDIDQ